MGLQTDQDPTCLESALHSFLSSVPGSVSRSRKPVYSGASPCSQSVKVEAGPRPLQERPGKLNKNEEPENKDQGGKVPELRKVLRLQNNRSSLNNDIFSEKPQKNPSTPRTPQPRNCDYFFTNGECVDSPWTVVSPVTPPCEKNTPDRSRKKHSCKTPILATKENVLLMIAALWFKHMCACVCPIILACISDKLCYVLPKNR